MILIVRMLKEKQTQELYQEFRKIDLNGDGMISEQELKNAFDQSNMEISEGEIKSIFKNLDFSGNDHINFSEFLVAELDNFHFQNSKNIKYIFDKMDKNADGKISKDDIVREFQVMDTQISKTELNKIFKVHGQNNQGYITYQDYCKIIMNI